MPEDTATLDYYATPGVMTDVSDRADLLGDVPEAPVAIAATVRGLLMHPHWAVAYDVEVTPDRQAELQARGARAMLDGILALDDRPLTEPRDPTDRFLGNCRDFTTLTTALLRRAGTPARARCGFAGYFEKGKWVDHWIVEHWNGDRWQVLDAQIDDLQRELTGLEPDPADLPPGFFLTAPEAWLRCRAGEFDGDDFGILDMWGDWFIAGNVGRDLAALNKVEMLPWDDWGALSGDAESADVGLVDEIAALIDAGDTLAVRSRYEADPSLQVSPIVMSLGPDGDWVPDPVVELGGRSAGPAGP